MHPHIFIDNNTFRILTKKDNGIPYQSWCQDFSNIQKQCFPSQTQHYSVIFTGFSLLEAIGLGKIKNTLKNKILLSYQPFMPPGELALQWQMEVFTKTQRRLRSQKNISQKKLREKTKEQILFSQHSDTNKLVKDTLVRRKKNLGHHKQPDFVYDCLAWDITLSYPYSNFLQSTNKQRRLEIEKSIDAKNLTTWMKSFIEGYNLPNFRLLYKMIRDLERDQNLKIINSKLKWENDLCDTELLNYSILGINIKGNPMSVICFTSDDQAQIIERIKLCKSLTKASFEMNNIEPSFSNGYVCFCDKNTAKIISTYDVKNETIIYTSQSEEPSITKPIT